MAKVYKPGFNYYKSEFLKQEVAMNKKSAGVIVKTASATAPKKSCCFMRGIAKLI
jgi:hypothetical protein